MRYARPRRSTTRSGALGSPAASGLSAGRGPFRAEPFATAGWFGPFPTQQRRQRLQWAVYRGKKHAQNPRGWGLSYRSQIAKPSSRRCAPIGAARTRHWCKGNTSAFQADSPDSSPGWRIFFCFFFAWASAFFLPPPKPRGRLERPVRPRNEKGKTIAVASAPRPQFQPILCLDDREWTVWTVSRRGTCPECPHENQSQA